MWCLLLVIAIAGGAVSLANAAEVGIGLSTRETYVGLPVTLRIQIADATKVTPPRVPEIDGITVKSLGAPSRSTAISMVNGTTTTSTTLTFAYELTPQRAGSFQIPPIEVNADGAALQTRAAAFVASKSETGDLLFVEIVGKQKQIYVGQSLDVTLRIYLRPYSDRKLKVKLSEGDMWRLLSDRSEFGPFADRLQQMLQNDQPPMGREVLRKDRDGVEHSYYLYEISTTIYPKRPGKIDGDNVKIVATYPTSLGRSRGLFADFFDDMPGGRSGPLGDEDGFSPFGAQLTIQTVRPLVAQASVEPIDVLPIPKAGQPADYRGAVGQYQIATDATPTHVKSGDPINLVIGVSGTGPMELVQAPPLAELPELTAEFKVPNEPLPGFVKGDRKVFSTTIRPRKADVAEIPSIPFSYFDPAAKKFVTVHSKPVSIDVEQAETLTLDAAQHDSATAGANPNAQRAGASTKDALQNYTGADVLVLETRWRLNSSVLVTLLALPPITVLLLALSRTRNVLAAFSGLIGSAVDRAQRAVADARDSHEVAVAIRKFVARQCGLNEKSCDDEQIVGAIRATGYRNLAVRCEQLLSLCASGSASLLFDSSSALEALKTMATQWLADWESESRKQRLKPVARSSPPIRKAAKSTVAGSPVSTIVAAVVVLGLMFGTGQIASAESVKLNAQQQETLLAEANDAYKTALEKSGSDAAEAKQGFADAAGKYQLLVDGGVTNSRLYFNLGNAHLEGGDAGKAIANYLRCLRINPTLGAARTNLARARVLVEPQSEAKDTAGAQGVSSAKYAAMGNAWLNSRVSPYAVFVVMIAAWAAIWIAVALRLCGVRLPWKTAALFASVVFAVAATSTFVSSTTAERQVAVVVAVPSAAGTKAEFPTKMKAGEVVEIVQKRGDSTRVRTEDGATEWLPSATVEAI
jgi:tetratricopeptide (TPR) repeat protein